MPIYEFLCSRCHRKISLLVRGFPAQLAPNCPNCDSTDLVRTISSFAYHKSTQAVWEESGEPSVNPSPNYYNDPRNIGRWAEKRFKEMSIDMPVHLQEKIQAAREGELPESLKELKSATADTAYL